MKAKRPSKRLDGHLTGGLRSMIMGCILTMSLVVGLAMITPHGEDGYRGQLGPRTLLSEDPLIGELVVSPRGETLGAINDVVIDSYEGRLVYALVSPEGYTGSSDEVVAVQWRELTRNSETREFVLNTTGEELKMFPRFHKDKRPELDDPCWDGDYQRFDDVPVPEDMASAADVL